MTLLDLRAPARNPGDARAPGDPAPAPGRRFRHLPVALLGLLVTAVVAIGAGRWPAFGDDEGTYVAQAWAVRVEGTLSHYTYWYDHPPFGWLQLSWLQATLGPLVPGDAVAEARLLVVPYAVASALLVGLLARRLGLARPTAVAAVLLMTLSPLALASLRGVYLDLLGLPWLLLALVLALSPRKSLWAHVGAGLAFAAAVLSKETFVLALPGLLLAARRGSSPRTRAFCTAGLLGALILVVLVYPLLAVLKGELLPGPNTVSLWNAIAFQLFQRQGSGTALDPSSGSAALVGTWLALDPWLLAGGVLLAPVAVISRRLRVPALTLIVLVAAGLRPGYLPQPYVVALLPFCAVIVAGCGQHIVTFARRTAARTAVVGVLAVALAALVLPSWVAGLREATTVDTTSEQRQALAAVVDTVPRQDRVLIDDTYYVDLVEAGFEPRYGAVWFFKMDLGSGLDPSVVQRLPRGWRDLDWVVSSPALRGTLEKDPTALQQVRLAVQNSRVVRTFGTGPGRVELRRVQAGA
ncbi:MAG: glycosyltransferase [Frankiales bacterium]|nr:glycosyltransferase [Frankiales bacterium]